VQNFGLRLDVYTKTLLETEWNKNNLYNTNKFTCWNYGVLHFFIT